MNNNKNLVIVLLGATGEGKSSFGNYILKNDEKLFKESNTSESCTDKILCSQGKIGTESENLFIIDTPGSNDSKNRDDKFITIIPKYLKNNHRYDINSFLIFFNFNKLRLTFDIKKLLYYYCLTYPIRDFWFHVAIVFTFSYEFFTEEQFQNSKNNKIKDFMTNFTETIKIYIKEINLLNGYNIEIPESFNAFFTDCGEVYPPFTHKRTDMEIKKIIQWATHLKKMDLSEININIKINFKLYKQIDDFIEDRKIYVNSEKYKIIQSYKKKYKTIDFEDKTKIIYDDDFYKTKTLYYKKFKYKYLISEKKTILDDNNFKVKKTYECYERWNKVDEYDNILDYGKKENYNENSEINIISRNWRIYNTEYKTEYDHVIRYDYEFEHEKNWILFIPIHKTYKQPYKLVQNLKYKKENLIDDLGNIKKGDWVINEYGSSRKVYYTSRYEV